MTLLGFLTLLSMLSPIKGSLTGSWVSILGQAFGWGMYLFPLILIGIGLWFVLRNFESLPQLAVERLSGLVLLFWNVLAVAHFVLMLSSGEDAVSLAKASEGGGYLGGLAAGALVAVLGPGGAAVALAAWFVIALALTLDITIAEMFRALSASFERLQDWIIDAFQEHRRQNTDASPPASNYIEYRPTPTSGLSQAVPTPVNSLKIILFANPGCCQSPSSCTSPALGASSTGPDPRRRKQDQLQ